jgi:hypothetical protein
MQTYSHHSLEAPGDAAGYSFVPLDRETRAAVPTACAAHHLNRQPQTLRAWACLENGPLRPVRVHGRLAWPVAELRRVLGVDQ